MYKNVDFKSTKEIRHILHSIEIRHKKHVLRRKIKSQQLHSIDNENNKISTIIILHHKQNTEKMFVEENVETTQGLQNTNINVEHQF